MSVKDTVHDRIEKARTFADRLRARYQNAYETAVAVGKEGLEEIAKVSETIEPRVREVVGDTVRETRQFIDDINRGLAEKSVPSFRRKSVSKLELEAKSASVTNIAKPAAKKEQGDGAVSPAAKTRKTGGSASATKKAAPKKAGGKTVAASKKSVATAKKKTPAKRKPAVKATPAKKAASKAKTKS